MILDFFCVDFNPDGFKLTVSFSDACDAPLGINPNTAICDPIDFTYGWTSSAACCPGGAPTKWQAEVTL